MVSFILLTVVNVFDFFYFSTLLFPIQQTGSRRKLPLVVEGHVTGMQSHAGVDFLRLYHAIGVACAEVNRH